MIFKFGELFCGAGGLALGAKNALVKQNDITYKIEHVWANDIDSDSCETYRKNIMPNKKNRVYTSHVKDLDIQALEPIDAFAYGFPCNDFSIVGEHEGMNGSYGGLYYYGVEVLNYHNPKWFFAENVGGITNANQGRAFSKILDDLHNSGKYGYNLTINKYKFEEYGIPQKRHRIIIIGIRRDLGLKFQVPEPITPNPSRQKTAKEAITKPKIKDNTPNHIYTNHPQRVIERLKAIPPGENAWYEGIPKHLRLNVKGAKLSQIYRRLKADEPSYTITGSGGGGTHGYHWKEPRALTNRERARLQTFPDDFIFIGGKESIRKQIGMAVPPEASRLIIEAILKTFAGIEYKSIEPSEKLSDWV